MKSKNKGIDLAVPILLEGTVDIHSMSTLLGRGGVDKGCCSTAYQEISLTKLSLREMPAPASKMEEWTSPMKSEETFWRNTSRGGHISDLRRGPPRCYTS